ncbi:hypothetical protein OS145_06162 [Idiomarina baltica OS145]|uniref:Uncharacterized protein n=1 Tax=Idiomarina baltica OS145 TaxID=314276 RepID=A0ABM9WK48_9GAMM|nr:hypothetical protein OS145_06162 [Idiomarina baltica OS145]
MTACVGDLIDLYTSDITQLDSIIGDK